MDIYITSDLGPCGERDTYKVFADKQTCYKWLTDNGYMYENGDESHWFHKDIETMERYGSIPLSLVVDVFPVTTILDQSAAECKCLFQWICFACRSEDDSGADQDHRDYSEDYDPKPPRRIQEDA